MLPGWEGLDLPSYHRFSIPVYCQIVVYSVPDPCRYYLTYCYAFLKVQDVVFLSYPFLWLVSHSSPRPLQVSSS